MDLTTNKIFPTLDSISLGRLGTTLHFEIREPDGSGYAANAGAKIFGVGVGPFHKNHYPFSQEVIMVSSFEYPLFPDSDVDEYEAFVLRNSGNDWESTVMRDGFITSIADDLNIDHQRRPALLFLNGEFWECKIFEKS